MKLAQAFIIFDRLLIERRGRGLEQIEREILTAAWKQETYQQIQSYQEQTVKNKAALLWQDLSQLLGIKITKQNIPQVLANWDLDRLLAGTSPPIESLYRTSFCGRLPELLVLQSTIELAQQRLICLYGMQGIGKTALIHQFTEQWASKFDRIVWISLQRMTPLIDTLEIVIRALGGSKQPKSPNMKMAIDRTIGYFQQQRCLVVFDRADAIFDEESSDGMDLKSDYLKFFDRLDRSNHQSFCILISITKPTQITCQNRSLELKGLDLYSCKKILANSELIGTDRDWEIAIQKYRGNPQHLKLVANTIRDIFNRSIRKFLDADILVYDRLEILLAKQLAKLSPSEIAVLVYLSKQSEPISLDRIFIDLQSLSDDTSIIKILDKLVGRYLVDAKDGGFSLPESIAEHCKSQYSKPVTLDPNFLEKSGI